MQSNGSFTNPSYKNREYASPENVVDFLKERNNFKQFSEILKETMTQEGVCAENDSDKEFITTLHGRLVRLGLDIAERTVTRWMNNEHSARGIFDGCGIDAYIYIIFALGLDLEAATSFLDKTGHAPLNIRSYRDAVILWCLQNKKPLSDAKELILRYENEAITDNNSRPRTNKNPAGDSNNTTNHLINELCDFEGITDNDTFLYQYLIPNKEKFTFFSKTAYTEFIKLKNPFVLTAIKAGLAAEEDSPDNKSSRSRVATYFLTTAKNKSSKDQKENYDTIPYSLGFRNGLKSYKGDNLFFNDIKANVDKNFYRYSDATGMPQVVNNLPSICDKIAEYTMENRDDKNLQYDISVILRRLISENNVFRQLLNATVIDGKRRPISAGSGKDEKKDPAYDNRKLTMAELRNSVLTKFPEEKSLSKIQRAPEATDATYLRNAIVLMYYFAYAYNYSETDKRKNYFEGLIDNDDFDSFYEQLSMALARCRLTPLNTDNRFDWLILRSVYEFDSNDCFCDFENEAQKEEYYEAFYEESLSFLNDTLAMIYPTDEELKK